MKKIIELAIFCFVLPLIIACESSAEDMLSKITVTTSSGTEYSSYQECCAASDFGAAAQYLAKMKKVIDTYKEKNAHSIDDWDSKEHDKARTMDEIYKEAEKYIAHEEALFLIAEGTEEATTRLMFLRKQGKNIDYSLDDLLALADAHGNNYLTEKVLKEYVNELASESNFTILSKGLHSEYVDGPENNEKISMFNQDCIRLLHLAIDYKKLDMANRVIGYMKPNIVVHRGSSLIEGVKVGYSQYYVQYINSDISLAKEILTEAIKSGAFN